MEDQELKSWFQLVVEWEFILYEFYLNTYEIISLPNIYACAL